VNPDVIWNETISLMDRGSEIFQRILDEGFEPPGIDLAALAAYTKELSDSLVSLQANSEYPSFKAMVAGALEDSDLRAYAAFAQANMDTIEALLAAGGRASAKETADLIQRLGVLGTYSPGFWGWVAVIAAVVAVVAVVVVAAPAGVIAGAALLAGKAALATTAAKIAATAAAVGAAAALAARAAREIEAGPNPSTKTTSEKPPGPPGEKVVITGRALSNGQPAGAIPVITRDISSGTTAGAFTTARGTYVTTLVGDLGDQVVTTPYDWTGCAGLSDTSTVVVGDIPTLSEWGAIIFGTLLFASVVFYIWRRRRVVTA
jgi:hypothetical protein